MTAKFVWSELKKLVVIDHEISTVKKNILEQEALITQQEKPLAQLRHAQQEMTAQVKELQKQLDRHEMDVAGMREEDVKKQAVLETLSVPKEYNALERELAELESKIDEHESAMVKIMEQQETLNAQIAEQEEKVKAQEQESLDTVQAAQEAIKQAQNQIEQLEKDWKTQSENVPEELGKSYMEIRSRVPNPVVPVIDSNCGACFYTLLHQDVQALNTTSIIRCKGCYRFLFVQTEQTPTEQPAS